MVLREQHVLNSEKMSSRNLSSEVLKETLIFNITLYLTFLNGVESCSTGGYDPVLFQVSGAC